MSAATWTVVALGGSSGGIGPTDTQLCALISLDSAGWQALGAPGVPTEVRLAAEIADAILPAPLRAGLPQDGGQVRVSGPAYPAAALESSLYHPGYAVRLGDQLLVCLQTR